MNNKRAAMSASPIPYAFPEDILRPYFSESEIACKGSGGILLADGFAEHLRSLREEFNRPMVVTSCCRSSAHNKAVGGATNSFHIYDTGRGTCAIDIATPTPEYRTALVKLALSRGWSVGIAKTFVHLDRRSDYDKNPAQVIFIY